jgi:L-ascorbate metabolism protein UlaG (beta-lactamase superfamily)
MISMKILKIVQIITTTSIFLIFCQQVFSHGEVSTVDKVVVSSEDHGEVVYLGNEAIMVSINNRKILFDPFFHNDFGFYQLVPSEIVAKLHQGIHPYNSIDMVLISHAHADHFAAQEVLKYMNNQSQVLLVAPQQAIEQLTKLNPSESVRKRFIPIDLALAQQAIKVQHKQIQVEAVRIPHAGWPGRAEIENIVYRVTLLKSHDENKDSIQEGQLTVIHMGDADPNQQHFEPHTAHWESKMTNVAFPPYWFYDSQQGRTILTKTINANKSIGLHVPVAVPSSLKESGLDYFSNPGESRVIKIENTKVNSKGSNDEQ